MSIEAPPLKTDSQFAEDVHSPSLEAQAHLVLAGACSEAFAAMDHHTRKRQVKRLQHLVKQLERDLAKAEAATTWRRWGELLTANLHQVRRGQARVVVEDFYEQGTSVEMTLDPQLSPQDNARMFFKRARRGERGREIIEARLQRWTPAWCSGPWASRERGTRSRRSAFRQGSHGCWCTPSPTRARRSGGRWR